MNEKINREDDRNYRNTYYLVIGYLRSGLMTDAIKRMFSGTVMVYNSYSEAEKAFWELIGLTNQLNKTSPIAVLSIVNMTTKEVKKSELI